MVWIPEGGNPVVCRDRAKTATSGISLVVPTGHGKLDIQYREFNAKLEITVSPGASMDLGTIRIGPGQAAR